MPIYEYRRPDGSTFELLQKFTDEALTVDPETGEPVQRVFHAPAIHFKGKGFHNTDYGTRRRNRELEKSGENGASEHADKSAAKSDGASSDGAKADGGSAASSSSADGGSAKTADAKPAARKAEKAA